MRLWMRGARPGVWGGVESWVPAVCPGVGVQVGRPRSGLDLGWRKGGSHFSARVPGGSQLPGRLCIVLTVVLLAEVPVTVSDPPLEVAFAKQLQQREAVCSHSLACRVSGAGASVPWACWPASPGPRSVTSLSGQAQGLAGSLASSAGRAPPVPRGLALRGLRLSAGLVQVVSGACLPSAVLDGGRVCPCAPV